MKSTFYFGCVIITLIGLCRMSNAAECSARGRFANEQAEQCRGYTICLMGGITNFTQYKLTCPQGTVYSHIDQQCTNATTYKCFPSFNCTTTGKFAVEDSKNCTSFIGCFEGIDGMATARLIDCPVDTLFDELTGVCVNSTEYVCPRSLNHGVQLNINYVTILVIYLIVNLLK